MSDVANSNFVCNGGKKSNIFDLASKRILLAIPKPTIEMALKSLKDDIDGIKSTVDKIVTDGEKKYEGLKKLEVKINGIEKILGETIPTLKFAKDCIEECIGRAVIMRKSYDGYGRKNDKR